MVHASAVILASPLLFLFAAILTICIVIIARIRRVDLPKRSQRFIVIGLALLSLAAGGVTWLRPDPREVLVMVDLSPSTRTAQYRNVDALRRRIDQLLGSTPRRLLYFAADNRPTIADTSELPDLPADKTVFNPPGAAAILLFSDCRFDLPPAAPSTYVAVDPMLEDPPDAAVRRLELRGQNLAASVANQSIEKRTLLIITPKSTATIPIGPGALVVTHAIPSDATEAAARLTGQDPWPENDQLTIRNPPPSSSEKWWIGRAPPAGWKQLDPRNLPLDSADYLAPSVIVLQNLSARDFSDAQQQRLQQYVRDLGGSLVILGGNRAFAAGEYPGTALESLSPLSSSPPTPTLHWMLLADSSGSMAAIERGGSRWDFAKQSLLKLLPHLPPEDPVSVGDFAENLRWWSQGKSARDTALLPLPPPNLSPTGPTNLEPALLKIISQTDATMPKELLVLTDADTEIKSVVALRAGLKDKKIRLHILAIGEGKALPILSDLARATDGQVVKELEPEKWTLATQKLFTQVSPERLNSQPVNVRFLADLAGLGSHSVTPWNRTWLKKSASALAEATAPDGPVTMAARWKFGTGTVLAAAYEASPPEAEAFAKLIAQPPRDPRFKITWDIGQRLLVTVDAANAGVFLNGLTLQLDLTADALGSTPVVHSIPQIAPGRYEISLPAPRQPTFAAIRLANRVLDRTAIAGRYAAEFDAIGNDHANMRELAQRTHGAVIPPTQTRPIQFNWPGRDIPLSSWLAAAGALFIAIGLIAWRFPR
jgi:hypothetical protein